MQNFVFMKPGALDRVGVVTSSLCALHCMVTALGPSFLAVLGLTALLSPEVEGWLSTAALIIASVAALLAIATQRRWTTASILAVFAFALLMVRRFEDTLEGWAEPISILIAVGLVGAHILNLWAYSRTPPPKALEETQEI